MTQSMPLSCCSSHHLSSIRAEVASAIVAASEAMPSKPVVASYLSRSGLEPALTRGRHDRSDVTLARVGRCCLGATRRVRAVACGAGRCRSRVSGIDRDRAEELVRDQSGWAGWSPPGRQRCSTASAFAALKRARNCPRDATPSITVSHDPVFGPVVSFGVSRRLHRSLR